jgi:hypothetical protein
MTLSLDDIAWHRSVGHLIDALDKPNFWAQLVRLLDQYVPCDSWVALLFSADQHPQVFAECPGEDGSPDQLFQDYLRGLYLLDPFYIACREQSRTGLYRLSEVAPEHFELTEYYQRYFRVNVVADEIQFNCQLEGDRTLCLSLGSKQRFSARADCLAVADPAVGAWPVAPASALRDQRSGGPRAQRRYKATGGCNWKRRYSNSRVRN